MGRSQVRRLERRIRITASVAVAIVVGGSVTVASIQPASADPGHPTNYQSSVLDVEPRIEGVSFSVLGGDAFLTVDVDPGHTATIPGYFNEPYIRIEGDGTVLVNMRSEAYFINSDRYGQIEVPDTASADAEPEWVVVGADGRYAWHDHRTHWMSEDLPPTIDGTSRRQIFPWTIPTFVDGTPTTVTGELVWIPSRSTTPALLAGMVGLLPVLLWKPGSQSVLGTWLIGAGSGILVISAAQQINTPGDHRDLPVMSVLAVVVIAIGLISVTPRQHGRTRSHLWPIAGSLVLGGSAALGVSAIWMPILPVGGAPVLQRAVLAAVLWSAIAIFVLAIVGQRWHVTGLGSEETDANAFPARAEGEAHTARPGPNRSDVLTSEPDLTANAYRSATHHSSRQRACLTRTSSGHSQSRPAGRWANQREREK